MSNVQNGRVAILWRGDRATRKAATPQNNRYHRIFEELQARGVHAEPAVYADEMLDEVRQQLMAVDGVLVWVNPLDDGLTRAKLDPMLREVASIGPWVSAHHPQSLRPAGCQARLRLLQPGLVCGTTSTIARCCLAATDCRRESGCHPVASKTGRRSQNDSPEIVCSSRRCYRTAGVCSARFKPGLD
jgi:hypothetical protein